MRIAEESDGERKRRVSYAFNFKMTAEKMFLQPEQLEFANHLTTNLSDSTPLGYNAIL